MVVPKASKNAHNLDVEGDIIDGHPWGAQERGGVKHVVGAPRATSDPHGAARTPEAAHRAKSRAACHPANSPGRYPAGLPHRTETHAGQHLAQCSVPTISQPVKKAHLVPPRGGFRAFTMIPQHNLCSYFCTVPYYLLYHYAVVLHTITSGAFRHQQPTPSVRES